MLYLPEAARFGRPLALPEGEAISGANNDAMRAIEAEPEALRDVLLKTYNRLESRMRSPRQRAASAPAAASICAIS